ncbi:MAG: hypothetical protein ACKVZH_17740 [Blastocatellia bacterium]
MKKLLSALSVFVFTFLAAVTVAAQSPAAGDWAVAMNTPGGVRNFTASLKIDGETLTGEIKENKTPLKGTAKGNDVQFGYVVNYNGNDLAITMTGKITGDAIKGTVSFGGMAEDEWSAKRVTGAAAAPAASSASNAGINVTGAWDVEVVTEQGSGNPALTFKQEGEKLTGTYKGLLGESTLTGTVKGDKIEFSFKVSGQLEGTVTYNGTTDGKTMKGKLSLAGMGEGTFTGKKK